MQKLFLIAAAAAALLLLFFMGGEIRRFFRSDDAERLLELSAPHSVGFAGGETSIDPGKDIPPTAPGERE